MKDLDIEIKAINSLIGYNHPLEGDYSPLPYNKKSSILNWAEAKWKEGPTILKDSVEFAIYSKNAHRILLEIYDKKFEENAKYDYWMQKGDDNIWRAKIKGLKKNTLYGFRCWGPNWVFDSLWDRNNSNKGFICDCDNLGNRFNPNKLLFDPRARELSHDKSNFEALKDNQDCNMYLSGDQLYHNVIQREFDTGKWAPKSVLICDNTSYGKKPYIPQEDAIIYEAHVRGLTKHKSVSNLKCILKNIKGFEKVENIEKNKRGTYAGVAKLVPYLKALGITTIELLPIHEADNESNPIDKPGGNFWGYMSYGFFAPDRKYSSDKSFGGPTREFKQMVRAFHENNMEVYLDVVYNHTGEAGLINDDINTAEITFFRGFDNNEYYVTKDNGLRYWETSGCGNNLKCDNPPVRSFILDSLSYWLQVMGVDGFRFDLAPVLGRISTDEKLTFSSDSKTLKDIVALGDKNGAEIIAEAWDCGEDGYQVGQFPMKWAEWNGRYRDTIRRFINNGDPSGKDINYAEAFNGNYFHFNDQGGSQKSINFICAHDGLTLSDLCSYNLQGEKINQKINWPFGPSNGGLNEINPTKSQDPVWIRQTIRNFMVFQMFSRGIPMVSYGDEFNRTQNGNNNPYNLDSIATYNNYYMINNATPQSISTGYSQMYNNKIGTYNNKSNLNGNFLLFKFIANLRKTDPGLSAKEYVVDIKFTKNDDSDGFNGYKDECVKINIFGSIIKGGRDYLLLVNMSSHKVDFKINSLKENEKWYRIVDTAFWAEPNFNYWEDIENPKFEYSVYAVHPFSITVLKKIIKNELLKK